MISILIPIYNFDVTKLVHKLALQCEKAKVDYEIICFDDCSKPKYKDLNAPLHNLFRVNYVELSDNLGRSKIRNKLAAVASYKYILFLDCDSKIKYAKFIKNYAKAAKEGAEVVYGGRVYNKKKPRSKAKELHWKYGHKREALPPKKRQAKPYLSFQSNNFLIDRKLFLEILFDKAIEGYGYEDLVFAYELQKKKAKITHIHNPIIHLDLQTAEVFLEKTAIATDNLLKLIKADKIMKTRLSKWAETIKSYRIDQKLVQLYLNREEKIRAKLLGPNPNLYYLDLYKLYLFLKK